jgi:deoxyribodipyrimidine photo-lyase
LLIDWRMGEKVFMQNLIDGDMASNNGGWQWSAGTGTDAQPFFRIFNPMLQGARFDPEGIYVRRYVPELAKVPTEFIHAPWDMPADVAKRIGFELGRDYPKPIVNHAMQRERALALYRTSERRLDAPKAKTIRNNKLEMSL